MKFIENITSEYVILATGLILLVFIFLNIIFFLKVMKLNRRIKNMLGKSSTNTIEDTIKNIKDRLREHEKLHKGKEEKLSSLEERVRRSIQGVETLRFNPFKGNGGGGNQSFATSLIDENGDGVVISTLYSRERVGIYAKPIKEFSSEHKLSEEEEKVISRSKEKQGLKRNR